MPRKKPVKIESGLRTIAQVIKAFRHGSKPGVELYTRSRHAVYDGKRLSIENTRGFWEIVGIVGAKHIIQNMRTPRWYAELNSSGIAPVTGMSLWVMSFRPIEEANPAWYRLSDSLFRQVEGELNATLTRQQVVAKYCEIMYDIGLGDHITLPPHTGN